MEKNDLILHKEYGVNPTIPICAFCGEDKNEIALLGAKYKDKAPMHMHIDNEPCDACKKRFDDGWKYFIGDCGHNGFIKEEALKNIINEESFEELKDKKIFRMEKCFQCMGIIGNE